MSYITPTEKLLMRCIDGLFAAIHAIPKIATWAWFLIWLMWMFKILTITVVPLVKR